MKDGISEKWVALLTDKQREGEEARLKMRGLSIKKEPIRETIDIKMGQLFESIEWYVEHFFLFTLI